MATELKIPKLDRKESEDEPHDEELKISFPPTDVILEVEGMEIHVNKQVLMDRSPMFKAMFESDFSEKHKERISLPGKKYTEFVNFLYTFYNPELLAPITEENVMEVVSLADEYQIMELKDKCESFILENCKRAREDRGYRIETETLVDYAACAEKHKMNLILSLIMELCARYSSDLLKQAKIETKVSPDTQRKILEFRCAFMEQEIASTLDKGEQNILQLMELAWEAQNDTKMKKCENRLVDICSRASNRTADQMFGTFTKESLLDYIIAAERYNLNTLLSSAIELASKCNSVELKNECKYNEITSSTKYEIDTKRLNLIESNYAIQSSHNLFSPPFSHFVSRPMARFKTK